MDINHLYIYLVYSQSSTLFSIPSHRMYFFIILTVSMEYSKDVKMLI